MSKAFELNAKVRTDLGKGASRRLRRLNHEIPAIVYGGHKDPVSITLLHKDIYHAVQNEAFFSHIITLHVGKNSEQVIIKALQRHPARPILMHADFQRVRADEEITVNVPIHFLNQDKCIGVKVGHGNIIHTLTDVEITCLPKDLPEYLEVDMINVDLGQSVHISDIKFPAGVQSVALAHGGEGANLAVASVLAPKGPTEDEVADAAKAEEAAKASADAVAAKAEKTEKTEKKD